MKKFFVMAAAAILAVSCATRTQQEKIDAYQAEMDKIMEEYNTAVQEYMTKEELTDEEMQAVSDLQDNIIGKINDLSIATIKKNPKDSVAMVAFKNCAYYLEPEEASEALKKMNPAFLEDPMIARFSKAIDAQMATKEGEMFTDFTVNNVLGLDEEGNEITEEKSLSDFVGKGKYILVDFWSPWCGPCKAEIPNLKETYEKYAGEKFDMLSVAVWEESARMNWQNTRDTAAVYGVCWNELNNGGSVPTDLYGIQGIPHIILFGPDGTIVKRDLRGEDLQKAVAEAVAE